MTTPALRLAAALKALHWANTALAAELRRDEKQVRRWLLGTAVVPEDILEWLEWRVMIHGMFPPPPRNRQPNKQ